MIINLQLFGETNDNNETNDKNIDLQNTVLELQEQIKEMNERNVKLLEQNQNLFLKLTGDVKETKEKDNYQEYKDFVGDEFFNSLTNKQQKLLITILEGED